MALLGGTLASLECDVVTRHPAGDHTILVAQVRAAELRDGNPLLYWRGAYRQLTG